MTKIYEFTVQGTAADKQTWTAQGRVTGEFNEIFNAVMKQAFHQLTGGKAVFGKPGVGCHGPYDIKRVLIKQRSRP